MAEAYIVDAVRTAGGRRGGKLAGWHPADLGGEVLNALVARTGIDPAAVEDVILGCVTQAGEQSFALARNAVLASRLPSSIPGVTIDRQCGSSQQALHFAAQAVMSGTQDMVIAGGVESMTRVPMFSNDCVRQGAVRHQRGAIDFRQVAHHAERTVQRFRALRLALAAVDLGCGSRSRQAGHPA
jgi:acetyl-CoA C-acetyltransferase